MTAAFVPETSNGTVRACPSCGHEPTTRAEAAHQAADLEITWLSAAPDRTGSLVVQRCCRHCAPTTPVFDIACTLCGEGPILTGQLAVAAYSSLPEVVQRWLAGAGWRTSPMLLCPDHCLRGRPPRGCRLSRNRAV